MTTYTIKNSNSIFMAGNAFSDDTAAADTLIVDQSGFLVATGALSYGARLATTLAWKVTVNGVITSTQFCGLGLIENNTGKSTITIGTEGEVFGGMLSSGVFLGSAATLTNSGAITGGTGIVLFGDAAHTVTNKGDITGTAVERYGIQDIGGFSDDTVTNSGTIAGDVDLGGGNNKLVNSGTMEDFIAGNGDDSVTNSHTMNNVTLGNGTNTVVNSSLIVGDIIGGTGADKVTNSKEINGDVSLAGGVNTFSNSGIVTGDVTATAGSTNTITNSKTIDGDILLDDGNDKVTNSGTVAIVDLGDGVNTLTNSGAISLLIGGAGIDTVNNTGTIGSTVDLGGGNDKYTGSAKEDQVGDSDGADTVKLGAGNDTYVASGAATDGLDNIDGGAGSDTYNASVATKVSINLDTVSHTGAEIGSIDPIYTVAKNIATGTDVGTDTILNFENAVTGTNDDLVHGSAAANGIETGAGNDIILGHGGNDVVDAGSGVDLISGGTGRDILYGGGTDNALDSFVYAAANDSTVAKAGRDVIMDFEDGFDKISLSLDSNSTIAGTQGFNFIGVNAVFTAAGQVRVLTTATGYAVEGDLTGDGKADFAIDVADTTHSITWTSADFFL